MTRSYALLLASAALVLAVLAIYAPAAFQNGFVWDDDSYVTANPQLRSIGGLVNIWTNPTSVPQWYPLTFTTFWLEYQLFGENAAVYHVTNLLLHAGSAVLLLVLLVRLGLPGGLATAFAAALVWAVHPVNVESVAWITERKNTLSGVFFFAAFIAWWHWLHGPAAATASTAVTPSAEVAARGESSPPVPAGLPWVAFVLFACALLSKTVTATLPVVCLLAVWWKHGRVTRNVFASAVPFLALGLVLGLTTAWLEQTHVGARGAEFEYAETSLGEGAARLALVGRGLAFYAGKLLWPAKLAFIYERWTPAANDRMGLLAAAAVLAVLVGLWLGRKQIGRGPAAAFAAFVVMAWPALGFTNVLPHRYSFVADHFVYLAAAAFVVGVVGVAAGVLVRLRAPAWSPAAAAVLLAVPLTVLAIGQTSKYRDPLTLWQTTVQQSPNNWMPWVNLGHALRDRDQEAEATKAYEHAYTLAPTQWDVLYEIGELRLRQRREAEARPYFEQVTELRPDFPTPYVRLAILDLRAGNPLLARNRLADALEAAPTHAEANFWAGVVLHGHMNAPAEAVSYLEQAIMSGYGAEAWFHLGQAQVKAGNIDRGKAALRQAAQLRPDDARIAELLSILEENRQGGR
ncbi:MAG: tetratricopeptide repeat protein [Phycisphaerae bacterium]